MQYKTIKNKGFYEFCEKRSKFICYSFPINSEDQAEKYISEITGKYRDARHNVYAYFLNRNDICKRCDDGEPQGTAGEPMLSVIKNMELKNVLVVISRYFGGILLGVGGLKRAYSHGAKMALLDGKVITIVLCMEFSITVSYSDYGKIENLLLNSDAKINSTEYGDIISLSCYVKKDDFENLNKKLTDVLKGDTQIIATGESYQNL